MAKEVGESIMTKEDEVITDSDREYAEYQKCVAQDFPRKKKILSIGCENCDTHVEMPLDSIAFALHLSGHADTSNMGHLILDDFFVLPIVQCKKCFGVCAVEIM